MRKKTKHWLEKWPCENHEFKKKRELYKNEIKNYAQPLLTRSIATMKKRAASTKQGDNINISIVRCAIESNEYRCGIKSVENINESI